MLTRTVHTASLVTAILAVASFPAAAQDTTTDVETHHIAITHHVTPAETEAEHQAVAQRLENQALDFEKQAVEHEQLAKEYRNRARMSPKANYVALANHCDSLARSLKASAAEARELAHLHADVSKLVAR